jgi:hypothetical protein
MDLAEQNPLLKLEEGLSSGKRKALRKAVMEWMRRSVQSLKLYEPLEHQKLFHESKAIERLALGGNRGGKTTICAVEVAMAVTGQHKYLPYPKNDGVAILCAKDGTQVSQVMWSKLFKPGLFRIFFDRKMNKFRLWRPWADTLEEKKRSRPSEPLIPHTMIKSIAWEEKARSIPKKVVLKNGWELLFFTSNGRPVHGIDVDLAWFDEEITNHEWYPETAARLVDRRGRFIWSATPQKGTDQLQELTLRALDQAGKPNPSIEMFHFVMDTNPFITEEGRRELEEKFAHDPDQYSVRIKGISLAQNFKVYPNFSKFQHTITPFEIPPGWCRYVVIDPGFANIAALFLAIPPDGHDLAGHVFVYDECYAHLCNVKDFAEKIAPKIRDHVFQAFLIDRQGSQRTEVNGKTICQQYAEQFAAQHLESVETRSNFIQVGGDRTQFGKNTLKGEVQQVRSWLWERDDLGGKPVLQIFGHCEEFIQEMAKYRNKVVEGQPTDTPDERRWSHGPDCLRYAVLHGVPYKKPRKTVRKVKGPLERLAARKRRRRKQGDGSYVLFGSAQ